MDARLLDMFHDAADEHILAVAERIDIDLDRIREIAVEEQRILAEDGVDLAGLVVGIARLDIRGHEPGQRLEQIIVEGRRISWMIAMARPPST